MNDPLSPAEIKKLPDMELSVITKITRARANQKQSEAAHWQRSATWCEHEQARRRKAAR